MPSPAASTRTAWRSRRFPTRTRCVNRMRHQAPLEKERPDCKDRPCSDGAEAPAWGEQGGPATRRSGKHNKTERIMRAALGLAACFLVLLVGGGARLAIG